MHRERYSTLRIVISHSPVRSKWHAGEAGRTCEMAEAAGPECSRREMTPPPENARRRIGGKRRQSPVAKRLREGRGVRASSQPSDKCLDVITMSRHYSDQGRAHEWKTRPSDSSSIVSSSGCRRARRSKRACMASYRALAAFAVPVRCPPAQSWWAKERGGSW